MNTCKTCKWWVKCDDPYYRSHGRCRNRKVDGTDESDDDGLESHAEWTSSVSTGPDFGCVHHEPKVAV